MTIYLNALNPTGDACFQCGYFFWSSLATLSHHFEPELTSRWNSWNSISGHRMTANAAFKLAHTLVAAYVRGAIDSYLASLPQHGKNPALVLEDVLDFIEFLKSCDGFRTSAAPSQRAVNACRRRWQEKLAADSG